MNVKLLSLFLLVGVTPCYSESLGMGEKGDKSFTPSAPELKEGAELENRKREIAHLTDLLKLGSQLGFKNVYDQKQLKRSGISVSPNQADAELLLANVIGEKGNRDNWQSAAHLVCIMAQMDESIADLVMKHLKAHSANGYDEEKCMRMVILLSGSTDKKMHESLKELFYFTLNHENKSVRELSPVILKGCVRYMSVHDADAILKLLTDEQVSPKLAEAAFKVMRKMLENASVEDSKALGEKLKSKLSQSPKSEYLLKLQFRTGNLGVPAQLPTIVKEDKGKALTLVQAMPEMPNDDAVPYLLSIWRDESVDAQIRSASHEALLKILSVNRFRNDEDALKMFSPIVEAADTAEKRRKVIDSLRKLGNRPYVLKLLSDIKKKNQTEGEADELYYWEKALEKVLSRKN